MTGLWLGLTVGNFLWAGVKHVATGEASYDNAFARSYWQGTTLLFAHLLHVC